MALQQCQFIDPRLGTVYTWSVNPPPDGIQPARKERQIQRTSNTGNVGATKQQGDDGPFILDWQVAVFHASQQLAMWEWFTLCKSQTIYLVDWEGNTYEGQIVSLADQWVGVLSGPGDAKTRLGYAKMEMQFECYRFVTGFMATAGVTP